VREVKLAGQVSRRPAKRELDVLVSAGEQVSIALMAMAIHEAGYEAVSVTGAQIGLLTDGVHTEARIRSIDTARIHKMLDRGKIVIVAGFQGVDDNLNITTLGRGGSDTTAVALAAALRAEMCEIYTDVDGVYTADPQRVPTARRIEAISYEEMLELTGLGAQVMHPRSIEIGKKYEVKIHVRSSFTDTAGTLIMNEVPGMEETAVSGATLKPDVGRITFIGLPNRPGIAAEIFGQIAGRRVMVDDIIQNVTHQGQTVSVSFTVDGEDVGAAQAVAESLAQRFTNVAVEFDFQLSRLSIVGLGMRAHSGVAAKMFKALADQNINIENVSTSEIAISVLVRRDDGERALKAVHQAFELDKST